MYSPPTDTGTGTEVHIHSVVGARLVSVRLVGLAGGEAGEQSDTALLQRIHTGWVRTGKTIAVLDRHHSTFTSHYRLDMLCGSQTV